MKAMGLFDLALVRPKHFPSEEAVARATGATSVRDHARVVPSLADAIADCGLVVGTSARLRTVQLPLLNPRECAALVWERLREKPAAIVFGPEQSGLTNEDLARCERLVHVPTAPDFNSLNLAMAVQIICYELRMARAPEVVSPPRDSPPATAAELDSFHAHLEQVLHEAGFLHPEHQRQIKLKLRRVFHRATLDHNEVQMLRGVLTALDPRKARAD